MTWLARLRMLLAIALWAGLPASPARADDAAPVRVAVVNTPHFSGLMTMLLAEFERATGRKTTLYGGSDVFDRAIDDKADIVIAHLGKPGMEAFVMGGHGRWPRTVFSNEVAIIGPPDDPAGVRGMSDAAAALKKIAASGSPFIANQLPGVSYLTDILLATGGHLEKGKWYVDEGVAKGQALRLASDRKGYVIFGALPFLRIQSRHGLALTLLVTADPILQRVMASTVVNPEKHPQAQVAGATALQDFLLLPATQALIASYRSPGSTEQLWWPAGRHNETPATFD
ncbi:MAG: substrate-binding domain-containing protein [Rhodocyclaceae bacterium]|nr:substrate-binding domain-containing protein [Rhodocyclaceae bacterium]